MKLSKQNKIVNPNKSTHPLRILVIVTVVIVILCLLISAFFLKRNAEIQGAWDMSGKVPKNLSVEYVEDRGLGNYISFKTSEDPKNLIDIFEDPSCPFCSQFYREHHDVIDKQLKDGDLEFNVHLMTFLDQNSGTTYSDDAAATLIALARSGDANNTWRAYNEMWKRQPTQGTPHDKIPTLDGMKTSLHNAKDEVSQQVFDELDREPDNPGERAYDSNITNKDSLTKTTNRINTPTIFINGNEEHFQMGDDEAFLKLFK